jgi:hypothetical protein
MWDSLQKIIGFGPIYIGNVLRLAQGPKRFIAEQQNDQQSLENAFAFLAVSFLFSWIVKASFIQTENPLIELGSDAAGVLLIVLAYGAVVVLSWRAVKGPGDIRKFFVVHFFYAGFLCIILVCWFLMLVGVLRASDPALFQTYLTASTKGMAPPLLLRTWRDSQDSSMGSHL